MEFSPKLQISNIYINLQSVICNRSAMYTSIRYIELNKSKQILIKHIYVGSERIVSKVSVNNPDYDPRQENCAGNSLTGYTVKLQSQQQALSDSIASIYAKFEVPYYPNNNDDYGYNWSDGLRRSVSNPDSYGELAYFYHSDHLGSTSNVTDANGEVSQHVEYVPFGEVFIEERNNTWNTPYLFNAKELDEEIGLYYYGARYYDPRTSLWLSTDPLESKYPNISTYTYCANNPIKRKELDGQDWIENENGDITWNVNINASNHSQMLKAGQTYRGTDYVRYKNWDNNRANGLVKEHYKSDKVLHYEIHNGIYQMDFTGKVVKANIVANKNINLSKNAEYGIIGTANLNAVFSDGSTFTTNSYNFASGSYGNGPTPNNNYTADKFTYTTEKGMLIYEQTGWKVYLEDFNNRTGLRIHPDTNSPGTAGCIGIQGSVQELKKLGSFFETYIKNMVL